eukprot:890821-Prorocentrum_minimum.AAC.1
MNPPGLAVNSQVVLPEGYLVEAYAEARAGGAVCIADEVQTGFGRVGEHFWAFQTQVNPTPEALDYPPQPM